MRYIPAEALALSEHRGHAAPLPVLGGHAQSPESRLTETASLQAMLDTFATYDTMRLTRFLGRGDPRRIDIRSRGRCQALRFDEVEYFNRIYHVDREAIAQLPDLLSGYRDLPHRVELVAAADTRLADF